MHVRVKMERYEITEELVFKATEAPTNIVDMHSGRKVHQLILNGKILRLVVETEQEIIRVVTVYKVRRERYEI